MQSLTLSALALGAVLLSAGGASAQHEGHGSGGGKPAQPATAATASACGEAPHGMGAEEPQADKTGKDAAQKAHIDSMASMTGPMMAAQAIKDPDVAFMCGMIAHHRGAIDMSEVVLRYGKDEDAKAMATKIIAAQKEEIAEMTAWIEKRAAKRK